MVREAYAVRVLHFLLLVSCLFSIEPKEEEGDLQIPINSQLAPNLQIPMHLERPLNLELAKNLDFIPIFQVWSANKSKTGK